MGFFDALGKLGKAVVGTALLPVDVAHDVASEVELLDGDSEATKRRLRKIARNVDEGLDEIDEE